MLTSSHRRAGGCVEVSIGDGSTDDEITAAWLEEVKRRRDDLGAGRTHTVPWEDVRQKLHAKIKRARERRHF